MKLSNMHKVSKVQEIKSQLFSIYADAKRELENKDLPENIKSACSDIVAIYSTIEKVEDEERIISSGKNVATLMKKAYFQGDVADIELRKEIHERQYGKVKEVTPRSLPEGKTLGGYFADNPTQSSGIKTASPIDHSVVAERIMRDLHAKYYYSAQDAYDGYCLETNSSWPNASPMQKCKLAKLLHVYGFSITYDKWEKEASKDKDEYVKQHGYIGNSDEYKEKLKDLEGKKAEAAKDTINYCAPCMKSTPHSVSDDDKKTCKECGAKKETKKSERRNATSKEAEEWISAKIKFLENEEGLDHDAAVGKAMGMAKEKFPSVPDKKAGLMEMLQLAKPNVYETTLSKLKQLNEPKVSKDTVVSALNESIMNMVSNPEEQQKQIELSNNPTMLEGFFDKLGQDGIQVTSQYNPVYDETTPEMINTKPEMTKRSMYDYACAGCNYKEGMEKQGEYSCPKCGCMMSYGGGTDKMIGTGTPLSLENKVNAEKDMTYVCGGCQYTQGMQKHGEYDCPKCGKKLVYSDGMAGYGFPAHASVLDLFLKETKVNETK